MAGEIGACAVWDAEAGVSTCILDLCGTSGLVLTTHTLRLGFLTRASW